MAETGAAGVFETVRRCVRKSRLHFDPDSDQSRVETLRTGKTHGTKACQGF
jgi:hypothetical protein